MIYIIHPQKDELLGYIDRQDYWDDSHQQSLEGEHVIQFKTYVNTVEGGLLVDRCRLLRQASTGGWQEFVAYQIAVRGDRFKQVIAIGAEQDLDGIKILEPGWRSGYTLEQYAIEALQGTGIQLDKVDYGSSKSRNFEKHLGAYSFLKRVAELYERELRFRVEVSGNRIIGRFVDLVERIGMDKRQEIVAGENMIGIERTVDSKRIVSALYCIGPEREDGTQLTAMVTDEDAFQRWNWQGQHIIDFYEPETDDMEMTLERLIVLGKSELKKRINSIVEYTIEAAVFEDDEVQLGDTLRIKDEGFVPPLYAESRAIFVKEPISGETYQKTYTVGEIKELKEEEVLQTFRQLQKRYGTRVIKALTAPPGARNVIWIQTETETGLDVAHTWSGMDWVSVTPVSPEQVGAEPKIPTGPIPPNPTISNKWVDTSGLLAELKMWNADTRNWDSVQGPPGADGVDGQDGIDGYTPVKGTDYFDGVDGQDGTDGTSSYVWIRYAQVSSGSGMVDSPTNAKYIGVATTQTAVAPADPAAYRWTLIKGTDGVPGEPGTDGKSSYLHIKYSDDGGATFTASNGEAVGDWIGTYVDFTSADSNSPSAYTWNKVKGEKGETGSQGLQGIQGPRGDQGIAGATGADGRTSYTHIAYSTSPTGSTGFSVSDPANKTYIGMYTDFTATDSTNPAVYKWTLIKGADGSQGIQGPTGASGQSPYLHLAYATNSTGTAGFDTVVSAGKTYIGTYTDFVSADSTDPAKYSWTLIKGEKGDTGTPGAQGIQGPVGPQGQTLYTWVKYADTPTTGMSDSPIGKTYIGLAYNKTTVTESSNYADYSWSLIKGADGAQGPTGTNGQTTYTWVKYADDAAGNGMNDLPDGKRFLGLAYNKTTTLESTNKVDYTWSPLYDNVIVGGRNLAFNSNFSTGDLSKWNNNGAVTFAKIDGRNTAKMGITAGIYQTMSTEETVYTYSFLAKALDSTTTANVGFLNVAGNARKVFNLTTSWAKYSHTTGVPVPVGQLLHIYSNGKTYHITDIKVEKGNVATDYTTAPEDVEKLMEDKAAAAEKNAKDFVVEYAGKKISRGPLPPTDPGEGDMWIDSSMGEDIWKRFNGIAWELAVYVTTDMISALGIDAGVIKFGTMAGATVLLGGANNENGVLIVNSSAGEPIAELNGDAGGFPFLSVGYIDAPNKVEYGNYTDEPLTYYVAPMQFNSYNEPSDENDGFGWNSSLRTIQEAIDRIPKFFDGTVRISLAYGQTFYEDIDISGFSGSGTLIIERSAETTRPTLRGSVNITNNNVRIEWRNVNVDATDDYAGFFIQNSCGLMADVSIIGASGNTGFAINVNTGGSFELYRIYMANVNTCIRASYGGYAYVSACTGSGATYGLQGFAGSIMGGGTAPTGGTSNTAASFGGQVTGSWSYPTPPVPPAPITKTVTTKWTANSDSGTWRTDYAAWDIYASANQVTQGSYAGNGAFRGAWFFGTGVASTLTGKTIRRIRIYMRREAGGTSATVAARIRPHTSASRPAGNVSIQTPSYNAGFSVGEGKWVTLPTSFHAGFTSGSYKGLSIDGTAYMKFIKSAVLEITYET